MLRRSLKYTSDWRRNFVSSSVFGDFQFKGKEKSELKSSYDIVIVGAGVYNVLSKSVAKSEFSVKSFL